MGCKSPPKSPGRPPLVTDEASWPCRGYVRMQSTQSPCRICDRPSQFRIPEGGGDHDPAHRDPPSIPLQLTGHSAYPATRLHSICLPLSGMSRRLINLTATHALPGSMRHEVKLGHNCKGPPPSSYSHLHSYAGHRKEATWFTARLFIAEEATKIPPRPG